MAWDVIAGRLISLYGAVAHLSLHCFLSFSSFLTQQLVYLLSCLLVSFVSIEELYFLFHRASSRLWHHALADYPRFSFLSLSRSPRAPFNRRLSSVLVPVLVSLTVQAVRSLVVFGPRPLPSVLFLRPATGSPASLARYRRGVRCSCAHTGIGFKMKHGPRMCHYLHGRSSGYPTDGIKRRHGLIGRMLVMNLKYEKI